MRRGPIDPSGRWKDPVRPVNERFLHELMLLRVADPERPRPLEGGVILRKDPDSRLDNKTMLVAGQSVGPKALDYITLYTSLALIQHQPSKRKYIAFKETMDALLRRQSAHEKRDGVQSYPKWMMDHPVKRTELWIHFARVLRTPQGVDDRTWMDQDLEEWERDALDHFLEQKAAPYLGPMYGKG